MRELNQAEADELNYILRVKDRTDKEYAKRIKEIGEEAEAIISGEWYRQMKEAGMNREEAIKIIKECKEKGFKHTFYTLDEYHEALDMAIKALEQEPCEDAISRQAVLDMMQMRMGGKELYKAVYELPPVTPQPKTGHWEWVQYDYNPNIGNCHCSECHCVVAEGVYKNEKAGIPLYKYCPQCGAKMVEPQESEG